MRHLSRCSSQGYLEFLGQLSTNRKNGGGAPELLPSLRAMQPVQSIPTISSAAGRFMMDFSAPSRGDWKSLKPRGERRTAHVDRACAGGASKALLPWHEIAP